MSDPLTAGPPWRLRVFINFGWHGWSEEYWLQSAALGEILRRGQDLCNRRRLWFGAGVEIVYAEVSRGLQCDDTWAVNVEQCYKFPLGRWPQPEAPNDGVTGWLYREETADNAYAQRLFRCVPDNWITDEVFAPAYKPLTPLLAPLPIISLGNALIDGQPPVLPAPGQNLQILQRSFLDALMAYCGFLKKGGTNQALWSVRPLIRVLYRSVSQRPRYNFWKRVSCEAGLRLIDDTWVGPTFSFCGTCVGVTRTCYAAPCRWNVGAPSCGIRFYGVPTTNPIYYGQLRFGPKISEPDYSNGPNTGEITTLGARPYWNGRDVLADQVTGLSPRNGTHADVTPQQAAGQEPWLFPLPAVGNIA